MTSIIGFLYSSVTTMKTLLLSFKEFCTVDACGRSNRFLIEYARAIDAAWSTRDAKSSDHGEEIPDVYLFLNKEGAMPTMGFVLGSMVPIWVEKGFKIIQNFASNNQDKAKRVVLRGFSRGAVAVLLLLQKLLKHQSSFNNMTFEVEAIDPVPGNTPLGACCSAFVLNTSLANQIDLTGLAAFTSLKKFAIKHHIYTDNMLAPFMARLVLQEKQHII